jgi:hypothetical protein
MDDQRTAIENQFIATNAVRIAEFGPEQYTTTGEKGVVLVTGSPTADPSQPAAEIRYLTMTELKEAGLVGPGGPPIQQNVTQALTQYDPASQVVMVFLYSTDGTVYLLEVDDLIFG